MRIQYAEIYTLVL